MTGNDFDVIIIGAGPGGYVTAIRAAQLGFKTCIIEKEHVGGICLNWGCIPTKALLRSAEIYEHIKHAKDYGLIVENPSFDLKSIIKRSRNISTQLKSGVEHLLKKNDVKIIAGTAKIDGPGKVNVTVPNSTMRQNLRAPHIIIATGSRPHRLPGIEPDGKLVWTYFEAMVPDRSPKSIVIIGSGAIGIEFACFFRSLETEVTVIEAMDQVLPNEDPEIAELARKQFEKNGIKIITGATVSKLNKSGDSVTVTFTDGSGNSYGLETDRVISAVGVVGNTEEIGLETTKVKTKKGCIICDQFGQTAEAGVYAIGDVAGPPMLAHKAEHEGTLCIEKIAGLDVRALKKEHIPSCIYGRPQLASVGITEAAAKQAGYELNIGRFPFIGNGKAIALGEPEGMIKTIFDAKTGELLGAHMVGAEVTELIQGFAIAMGLETTEEELLRTIFPHPTLSEMMHESVLDAYKRAIHI